MKRTHIIAIAIILAAIVITVFIKNIPSYSEEPKTEPAIGQGTRIKIAKIVIAKTTGKDFKEQPSSPNIIILRPSGKRVRVNAPLKTPDTKQNNSSINNKPENVKKGSWKIDSPVLLTLHKCSSELNYVSEGTRRTEEIFFKRKGCL